MIKGLARLLSRKDMHHPVGQSSLIVKKKMSSYVATTLLARNLISKFQHMWRKGETSSHVIVYQIHRECWWPFLDFENLDSSVGYEPVYAMIRIQSQHICQILFHKLSKKLWIAKNLRQLASIFRRKHLTHTSVARAVATRTTQRASRSWWILCRKIVGVWWNRRVHMDIA